jgi:5-methylcytosine-specific restriction endonuclease McrA
MQGQALVLNATYEPLTVVSERRAAVLVLRGRAVLQEPSGRVLHGDRVQLPVPAVIRLTSFVLVPHRPGIAPTRAAVFARDDHRCQYCDGPAESLDHVVPRSRGGGHSWENVVACCRRCNTRKGDRLPSETGYRLRHPPRIPTRFGWVYARATRIHPSWETYLAS